MERLKSTTGTNPELAYPAPVIAGAVNYQPGRSCLCGVSAIP
jgi:hypothetical protein